MQLVFIIAAIVCFIIAFLALEVRGLRFEWLGFALWFCSLACGYAIAAIM